MAGAMRKVAVYLGLVEDQGRYDEDDYLHEHGDYVDDHGDYGEGDQIEEVHEPAPVRSRSAASSRAATVASLADRRPVTVAAAPAALRTDARITTLHPRTYNEARTIGEHFRDGTPVIMNLTEMDDVDAKRLVDFAAGLVFGMRGSIERVTAKVFLLSPADVQVTAEDKAKIAEGGFFNQS